MVQFRLTCPRHRVMYLEIMRREGVRDPAEMERIRQRFVALVSRYYPASFVEHLEQGSCLGCAAEEAGPSCVDWALEALRALSHGAEPPPPVYRKWTEKAVKGDA